MAAGAPSVQRGGDRAPYARYTPLHVREAMRMAAKDTQKPHPYSAEPATTQTEPPQRTKASLR